MGVTRTRRYASHSPLLQDADGVAFGVFHSGFLADEFADVGGAPALAHVFFANGLFDGCGLLVVDFGRASGSLFGFEAAEAELVVAFFPEVDFAVGDAEFVGRVAEGFFVAGFDHE